MSGRLGTLGLAAASLAALLVLAAPAVAAPISKASEARLIASYDDAADDEEWGATALTPESFLPAADPLQIARMLAGIAPAAGEDASDGLAAFAVDRREEAFVTESLRDVLRTYVNRRNAGATARPSLTIDEDEDRLFDFSLEELLLRDQRLGAIVRAVLGDPLGDPGHRAFELFGFQFKLDRGSDGSLSLYEYTTNRSLVLAPERAEAELRERRRRDPSEAPVVSERQIIQAALDFVESPLGIIILMLLAVIAVIRITISIAAGLQHARS
jgi:hypothetical protein